MTCIAIIADCDLCRQHRREHDGECDDLCRMFAELAAEPEGHEAIHQARLCSDCGTPKYDEDGTPTEVSRPCRYGRCVEWYCSGCDRHSGGFGPASCPCDSTWFTRLMLRWWDLRERIRKAVKR